MFVILAGGGELRFGVKRLPLRRHDIITLRVPPACLDEINARWSKRGWRSVPGSIRLTTPTRSATRCASRP